MTARTHRPRRLLASLTLAVAGLAGCTAPPVRPASRGLDLVTVPAAPVESATAEIRQASAEGPVVRDGPLTLDDLLALTRARNPDLAAAAARVSEAQGQLVQAGLYPNPTVGYMGNQINDGPGTAGQQGAFVSQEVVTGGKLDVARAAARDALSAADWQAVARWNETAARVRSAYYEVLAARATRAVSEGIVEQFEAGLRKAEGLARAGTVMNFEVLRFRVELTQARNRAGAAGERLAAAERLLTTAVGVSALPAPLADADLPTEVPAVEVERALAGGEEAPAVREAAAMAEQARAQVRLAELQNTPNLQLQTAAMYDFAIRAPMANVQVGVMLPVWNRNEGNILAARGRLAQAEAGIGQARVRLRERLTAAYQKYRNARRQADLIGHQILPDARTALEQVEKVYEARGERFFETLDARRVVAQARIDQIQAVADAWQAVTEIESLIRSGRQ
jgi:outer membrane protein, heavy metal efflux system